VEKMLNKIMRGLRIRLSKLLCDEATRKVLHDRINGYDLLVLANEDVGRQIHYLGSYEKVETDYLSKNINSNAICVDIGANIGYFTMLMAQKASSGCVHAFEPIKLNASLLKVSAELNGFTNIRINQCAVGNVEGNVSFSQSSDSAYSSMIDTDRKPLDRILTVPSITLDAYLEREGISQVDVLKVDVEGAEDLVLTGATRLLNDEKRRPSVILMELYDGNLQAFGTSVDSIVEKLQGFGYRPIVINKHGEALPFSEDLKLRYYNVLFLSALAHNNQL
jgi:FkbM family methyltransferase